MARRNSGARQTGLFDNAHGQNGKGSGDRTINRERFVQNMDEIPFTGKVQGFVPVGKGKVRKHYG